MTKPSRELPRHDVRIEFYGSGPGALPICRTCDWHGPVSFDQGIQARLDAVEHSRLLVEQ